MDADQKRQLENRLIVQGLQGEPQAGWAESAYSDFLESLAGFISDFKGDRHRFLEDLINECPPHKRSERYHALVPRIRNFTALSLQDYEARIANRASEMVSQRRMRVEGQRPSPVNIGGKKYEVCDEVDGDCCVITVKCRCKNAARYICDTPAGGMIQARKAGWVRDPIDHHEMCPKCAKKKTARAN